MPNAAQSQSAHRSRSRIVAALVLFIPGILFLGSAVGYEYLQAASVLSRISDPGDRSFVAEFGDRPVSTSSTTLATNSGSVRSRLYVPSGFTNAPGLVIIHGVHHDGIDERRLVNFSRAMAASGVVVMTPELPDLADYHVTRNSIDVIGLAVRDLSTRLGVSKVGVMGLSFAGGLALMAAGEPAYAPSIDYVVSVGGHHDLSRVLRYFATNEAASPKGGSFTLKAHEYGLLVVVYSHPEDFFAAEDVATGRHALRLLLWEKPVDARAAAAQLSPDGQRRFALLADEKTDDAARLVADRMPNHAHESEAVSPHGHLASLSMPVLLLHGAGDNVIPPTETKWLASEIPPAQLKAVLISRAISHVEVGKNVTVADKLELLRWANMLLAEAHRAPRSTRDISQLNAGAP